MKRNLVRKVGSVVLLLILTALLIAIFFISVASGSVHISFGNILDILMNEDNVSEVYESILFQIRLPRVLAAIVGGAALAVAGLLLQVFFRNVIVEPFVLGISSGASLGVGLLVMFASSFGVLHVAPRLFFLAALVGAAAVMILVLAIAHKVRNIVTLLVVGLMIGYVASAAITVLVMFARHEQFRSFMLWTMGSFSGVTWEHLTILTVVSMLSLIISFILSKKLNAFLLGEDYAKSMGLSIKTFRVSIIAVSSLLSGVVTAFAGPVAFIGLAVPHISRLIFTTSDNRLLIPASILLGGILTALCDLIARMIFAPVELPISAVTAFVGAPIVIALLLKRRNV